MSRCGKLHVLTAISRPENLTQVGESLARAASYVEMDVIWHGCFNLNRQHVGGQALKNEMLDGISDGWCWILDDDTLVHEDVLWVFEQAPHMDAVVVSQLRTDGRILRAGRTDLGYIDAGQAFIRREWIGDRRIPLDYNGDCFWLQGVLAPPARVAWLPDVVSLHNAISGVDVSALTTSGSDGLARSILLNRSSLSAEGRRI